MPNYISKTIQRKQFNQNKESSNILPCLEDQMKARDKALIAIGTIFFKRAGEILHLRKKDILITETEIRVTFQIEKKKKRMKFC